jgi:sulfopyruvate decarboxylase subunit beta
MDMSYATPLCLGLALGIGEQRVVAIEGDGSMLMGLGVLTTIARYQPWNLVLVVLDNESYSTIESPGHPAEGTATATGLDIATVARACGIEGAVTVRTESEADEALARAMSEPGPWVIVAKAPHVPPKGDPRAVSPPDLFDNSLEFAEAVRSRLPG